MIDLDYFSSADYLEQSDGGYERPNWFSEPHLEDMARILFAPKSSILDVGCGEGSWVNKLRQMGYCACGVDVNPPDKPFLVKADFFSYQPPDLPFDYLISSEVLMYYTLQEIRKQVLPRFWNLFKRSAVLYTPSCARMSQSDPRAVSFVSATWLRLVCASLGGSAFVLNYESDPDFTVGPSVFWTKDTHPRDLAWKIACDYRSIDYPGFTVSI